MVKKSRKVGGRDEAKSCALTHLLSHVNLNIFSCLLLSFLVNINSSQILYIDESEVCDLFRNIL